MYAYTYIYIYIYIYIYVYIPHTATQHTYQCLHTAISCSDTQAWCSQCVLTAPCAAPMMAMSTGSTRAPVRIGAEHRRHEPARRASICECARLECKF